jgi:hypothetical protein
MGMNKMSKEVEIKRAFIHELIKYSCDSYSYSKTSCGCGEVLTFTGNDYDIRKIVNHVKYYVFTKVFVSYNLVITSYEELSSKQTTTIEVFYREKELKNEIITFTIGDINATNRRNTQYMR